MDPRLKSLATSRTQLGNPPTVSILPNQRFENSFLDHSFPQLPYIQSDSYPRNVVENSNGNRHEDDSPEDCDVSDTVLRYINQMLMEEDIEDKTCMLQDTLDLQAAERSFYEVLGKTYPPLPDPNLVSLVQNDHHHQPYETFTGDSGHYSYSFNGNASIQSPSPYNSLSPGMSSSSNSVITSIDGPVDSPSTTFPVPDWSIDETRSSISQFLKGVEEANKFLPNGAHIFNATFHEPNANISEVRIEEELKRNNRQYSVGGQRGRKNPHREENEDIEEGRRSKQPSVYVETEMERHVFDRMVLYTDGEGWEDFNALCNKLKNTSIKDVSKVQAKGLNNAKERGKKRNNRKKEVVDLRTLLISCAQAVAADDHGRANGFLKQVRQHSSPFGDGNQRLAHCFANGLEARLAGTGSQIYRGLVSKRTAAANLLKAYHLYLAASPFRKLTNFVSNLTIMNLSANSTRLHIIDFGIFYGFQWPTLIQRLSWRHGGSQTVRITGIDFPQPGFRPAERVNETGCRLATYAKQFGVPFEYKGIAKKWDTIKLEELEIDKEEVVIVTCLYWAKNLLDETVALNSPKDILLELVKKIKPDVFIHGINNGAYNAPFFVTRFREALFHFSSLFDMLDTIVPRDNVERMLIEKELIGREALNVVACEGSERIERPETYKQWQVRSLRAGFVQLPFDRDLIKRAFEKVRKLYHKDFLIDQDGRWLLQGWKGRIIFTLSAWRPA